MYSGETTDHEVPGCLQETHHDTVTFECAVLNNSVEDTEFDIIMDLTLE